MIVKMRKVYAVTRSRDRDRLLECIRDLGVVHLAPVAPVRPVASEKTVAAIANIERALQILSNIRRAGQAPDIPVVEAAQAALDIQRRSAEGRNRLVALHRQLEQLSLWGDVELRQFEQLREAGIDVQFLSVASKDASEIEAECVQVISPLPGKRSLVAVIDRRGEPRLPDRADRLPLPRRDAPSIRAEAAEIDAEMKRDARRLAGLAHLTGKMRAELSGLRQQAEYTVAMRGALGSEHFFAIQGWVPAEKSGSLATAIADAGIEAAVQTLDPAPDEAPPTLIRSPYWTRPIEGLFKILGTVVGYREFDVSAPFMIALPIFAAMLISDGGYGVVLFLTPLLLYKKASKVLGREFTQLVMVVGAVSRVFFAVAFSAARCIRRRFPSTCRSSPDRC